MKSYIVNCIFVMWNYFSLVCIIQTLLTVLTYGDGDFKYMYSAKDTRSVSTDFFWTLLLQYIISYNHWVMFHFSRTSPRVEVRYDVGNIKEDPACISQEDFHIYWLYLEHLVPLLIWILTSCPFDIIWEVLLATARWFLTSWGNYIFIMHAYIFILFYKLGWMALLVDRFCSRGYS